MKTSTIKVRDMLSVLSVLGVEKRIGEVPGVESVTVNYAAGSATVRYDETRLNIADIKSLVRQSGYDRHPSSGRESVSRPGAHPSGGDIVTGRAAVKGVPPRTMAVPMLSVFMVSIG